MKTYQGRCIKLTIDGNFAVNGNYNGNRAQQPMKIKFSMAGTIDGKVTINGKFCATGPGMGKDGEVTNFSISHCNVCVYTSR